MSVDWTVEAAAATALRAAGIESDLTDAQLHKKALSAVQEITARGLGPQVGIETFHDGWGQRYITLSPLASAITSVTEETTVLAEGDDGYRIRSGGTLLERLHAGFASYWSGRVAIIYDALPADERYDRVVTDLVRLALEYSALDSRRDGDYSEQSLGSGGGAGERNYQSERDLLISELVPAGVGFA